MFMRKSHGWLRLSSLTLLSALGCASAKTHDIGDDVATLGLELSDYAAQWSGYAEAYTFSDYRGMPSSDVVQLSIDEGGEGHLRVGDSTPLPVATDPDAYPPITALGAGGGPGIGYVDTSQVVSGKDYPLDEATVEARRLKLKVHPADVYEDWCTIQTPVATGEPDLPYDCAPGNGGSYTSSPEECTAQDSQGNQYPISCGKYAGCVANNLCSCTETECRANSDLGYVELDAALSEDGNTLEGTLVQGGQRIVVRMTK